MSSYYREERAVKGREYGLYLAKDIVVNGCEVCADAMIFESYKDGVPPTRYGSFEGEGKRLMFCPFKECPYKETK